MFKIKKCSSCGSYTLSETCKCGGRVASAHPPKFTENAERHRAIYKRLKQ